MSTVHQICLARPPGHTRAAMWVLAAMCRTRRRELTLRCKVGSRRHVPRILATQRLHNGSEAAPHTAARTDIAAQCEFSPACAAHGGENPHCCPCVSWRAGAATACAGAHIGAAQQLQRLTEDPGWVECFGRCATCSEINDSIAFPKARQ